MPDTPKSPPDAPDDAPKNDGGQAEGHPEPAAGSLTQEELLRRVEALGEDDEAERVARAEEKRLAERRAQQSGGTRKKTGLEEAASRRLAQIGAKPVPKRVLIASDIGDPLLNRTAQVGEWVKKNSAPVAWGVGIALVAALAFAGFGYFRHQKDQKASVELAQALADQAGRIGDPDRQAQDPDEDRPPDPMPFFKSADERRESALKKYRDVEAKYPGTGAALLARLAAAGLLLDKHDADGAIAAYKDVKESPLGQADGEVRARALEGIGFAYELKALAAPQDAPKHYDEALKAFRELEKTDLQGLKELGQYHQARCFEANGDKGKAIALLKAVHERIAAAGSGHPFIYLEPLVEDRLRALDPAALPARAEPPSGRGGRGAMSQEQIEKLLKKLREQQGAGSAPAAPEGK